MQQTNAPTPVNKGTYICDDGENGFFSDLVGHRAGREGERANSGQGILDILTQNCAENRCIRTWVHAQHGWGSDSPRGKSVDGGFGGGNNGDWTGFYGRDRDPQPAPEEGGRARGGRSLDDLQADIDANRIRFCRPCRIYIYSCEVSTIGTFASRLSQMTGCKIYAAQGKSSTAHNDGSKGTSRDPWRAEGGWDTFDNGQRTPVGDKYITPINSW